MMAANLGANGLPAALGCLQADPPSSFVTGVLDVVGIPYDRYVEVDGPAGGLLVAFNAEGISYVTSTDAVHGDRILFEAGFRTRLAREAVFVEEGPAGLAQALRTGMSHGLSFDLRGLTPFERAVLTKTCDIPPGHVRSYSWIGREVGSPRAARSVGSALARNPVPVLIPCHRVIRSDGHVGQYLFGTATKRALLELEGIDVEALAQRGALPPL